MSRRICHSNSASGSRGEYDAAKSRDERDTHGSARGGARAHENARDSARQIRLRIAVTVGPTDGDAPRDSLCDAHARVWLARYAVALSHACEDHHGREQTRSAASTILRARDGELSARPARGAARRRRRIAEASLLHAGAHSRTRPGWRRVFTQLVRQPSAHMEGRCRTAVRLARGDRRWALPPRAPTCTLPALDRSGVHRLGGGASEDAEAVS
jgi:hypothetical protein